MQRFRGGLVFKAHRLWVSLNSRLRVIKKKKDLARSGGGGRGRAAPYLRSALGVGAIRYERVLLDYIWYHDEFLKNFSERD